MSGRLKNMQRLIQLVILISVIIPFFASGKSNKTTNNKTFIVTRELVTPNPSLEAKALYRYLTDMYGEKILSGQMVVPWGIDELDYIKSITGKHPAIRGIDFIHEKDNETETQNAIEWWKAGGIPTIMWHWGAPSIGEGYENSKKQIDIQKCFTEGTPEYEAFWNELKIKADHLEVLRDANVPVLWRPFHELNGDWFWWSKQGPDLFKTLWQNMFNYFVNERKLDNLIWVLCYTGQPDKNWYPGDAYVDIVAADTYDGGDIPHVKMFEATRLNSGTKPKLIAYHECGTMPNPEDCVKTGAMWSWWMEWHTSHLQKLDQAYLRMVYNNDLVVTLDEVPDIVKEYGENNFSNDFRVGRDIPFSELKSYTIGKKTYPGRVSLNDNVLQITAGGADFWGKKDAGHFVFKQFEGDFDLSIRVNSLDAANLYTKAGIMARVDLTDKSQHVYFLVFPDNSKRNNNDGGCEFQYRQTKAASSYAIYPNPELPAENFKVDFPNTWIRLTREGDFFRAYISHDNKNWHQYSRHKQVMPEKLLVGLAVTSHDANSYTTAEFENLLQTWK